MVHMVQKPADQTDFYRPVNREDRADGQGGENREEALQEQEHREEPLQEQEHRDGPLHWWDCDECSFQAEEEDRLERHINETHRITGYTCRGTFKSFGEMIERRRAKHPSTKKCNKFPQCVNGDRCLYIHEESVVNNEDGSKHSGQTQGEDGRITCRTCQEDFKDKNKMMVHRKIQHLNVVACYNVKTL